MSGQFEQAIWDAGREAGLCPECPFLLSEVIDAKALDSDELADGTMSDTELEATWQSAAVDPDALTPNFFPTPQRDLVENIMRRNSVGVREAKQSYRDLHLERSKTNIMGLGELATKKPCPGSVGFGYSEDDSQEGRLQALTDHMWEAIERSTHGGSMEIRSHVCGLKTEHTQDARQQLGWRGIEGDPGTTES